MHSLYRYFSKNDELLYIGVSHHPFAREVQHEFKRDMTEVRHIEVEWFQTKKEARSAERVAIKRERPAWNVVHQRKKRKTRKTPAAQIQKQLEVAKVEEARPKRKPSAWNPNVKWGARHWYFDNAKRQKHIQGLYNAEVFTLEARPTEKAPKAVKLVGISPDGLMNEANAADPEAKEIKNSESIRRWLREGAPGLDR